MKSVRSVVNLDRFLSCVRLRNLRMNWIGSWCKVMRAGRMSGVVMRWGDPGYDEA